MRHIYLFLLASLLIPVSAWGQDDRQRTVTTIVQDVLAQLPVQDKERFDREAGDIVSSAPVSVVILADMLGPASEGSNNLIEYAINGAVRYATENTEYKEAVRAGLREAIVRCGDLTNKAFLISQLALCSEADDLPVLVECAAVPELASPAVNAIINTPGSEAVILDMIKASEVDRGILAYAAASKHIPEAEPYLLGWLAEMSSGEVPANGCRNALYPALASCGSEASLKVLKDGPADCYIHLLQRLAMSGDCKTALDHAERLMKSGETHVRCAALGVIVSAKGAAASSEILKALDSDDREFRNAALDYASGLGRDAMPVSGIAKRFRRMDDEAKTDVVNWAGVNRVSDMLGIILPCTGSEDGGLACAAIEAAGLIGGDEVPGVLTGSLGGRYGEAAYSALLSFKGDITGNIAGALKRNGQERIYALRIAASRRMKEFAPEVFAIAANGSDDERMEAYAALQYVAAADDCARLGALLETASAPDIREMLQKAVYAAVSGMSDEKALSAVKDLMGKGNAVLYYPVLAAIGTPAAMVELKREYESGDREKAFDAMISVNNYAAADILYDIASGDASKKDAALMRFVSLVSSSGLDADAKNSRYVMVMKSGPSFSVQNRVLKAMAGDPAMSGFMPASKCLYNEETAYNAAAAVKSIAAVCPDEIDASLLGKSLEKAAEIFAATGGADDGYAVDEIRKILAGIQTETTRFVLPADEAVAGYEVLFDGTDLSGWTGDLDGYTPVNGTIFVTAVYGNAHNLYTKKEYGDFILRFDFCFVRPGVNNGVGIRTPMGVDAAYHGMCEIQILDHDDPIYKGLKEYQVHGSAYGIIPAKRVVHKPLGEWNTEEIKVVGDHITVTLNGEVILDGDLRKACQGHNVAPDGSKRNPYTADGKNHPGMFNKKGHIGFLGHGAGIRFRNVRILELL